MSEEIFVIGNGPSRKVLDLEKLHKYGKIYGCNALYRDYMPDILFVVDAAIVKELADACFSGRVHTNANCGPLHRNGLATRETQTRTKSSGGLALQQAGRDTTNGRVYMFGFDNMPNAKYIDSNIYSGTKNYVRSGNWSWRAFESDFSNVIGRFPNISYINVINPEICNPMTETVGEKCPNYSVIEYKDFPYQDCLIAPADGR